MENNESDLRSIRLCDRVPDREEDFALWFAAFLFRKRPSVDKRTVGIRDGIVLFNELRRVGTPQGCCRRVRALMRHEKTLREVSSHKFARHSLGCAVYFRMPEPITVYPSHVESTSTAIHPCRWSTRLCPDGVCVRINLVERSR